MKTELRQCPICKGKGKCDNHNYKLIQCVVCKGKGDLEWTTISLPETK